jgi:hypothetical protein
MGHITGLSNITKAELHEGAPGQPGNLAQPLTMTGNTISGTLDLDQVELTSLLSGLYYVNIHTTDHPNGELRGQLTLEQDYAFLVDMNGGNEVPDVTTNGKGLAVVRLSQDSMTLSVHGIFEDLSGPALTAALYFGDENSTGNSALNLNTPGLAGTMAGTYDLSANTNRKAIVDSLLAGHVYLNLTTLANTNGEIRGQLMWNPGISFDAMLTGAQEVPPVTTTAQGVGFFTIEPDLSALNFDVYVTGLSGAISDAHLHLGPVGVKGGVIVPLGSAVNGNRIKGSVDFINNPNWPKIYEAAIKGHLYVNVHTVANPSGEIRGQLMPQAREGYIFNMTGAQEVPAVTTSGRGFAVATIDRDHTNMHYMAAWSGLSGTPTAAHFHQGGPGEIGAPVLDVSSMIHNNTVMGFWNGTDFTNNLALFEAGRVYFNVHTAANSAGEIRGNLAPTHALFTMQRNPMFDGRLTFSAMLNGAQEVQPVNTNARGVAGFQLSPGMDTLWVIAQVNGLSSSITGAHIHEGEPGENGSVIQDLNMFRKGNKFYGMLTGSALDNLLDKMFEGETYMNVHTANNPNGEIRGQIMLESDYTMHADMRGGNEVPAVSTTAKGIAVMHLSHDKTTLHVHALVTGLSSAITGAHLHIAEEGTNGPVIVDLMPHMNGNMIDATIRTNVLGARLDSLMEGDVYVNVHTTNNPKGEIRGQIMMAEGLAFMTMLDGGQETPAVPTQGMGLGYMEIDDEMESMMYHVVFDKLTGTPTASHFHKAPIGASGGVVVNLTDSMSANEIKGTVSGTGLTKAFIMDAIKGDIYVNVHTPSYPGGEIRGQLVRSARQGFVFDMCTGQETGTVNGTTGKGVGVVSISPMLSDVHYLIGIDSLSGASTGQHFHAGGVGTSGSVLFGLNNFVNGISDGHWSDTLLVTPLTEALVRDLQTGKVYVNIHTANNANGEIRGQVANGAACETLSIIEEKGNFSALVSTYPVPFTTQLTVAITSTTADNYKMRVIDMHGREVLSNKTAIRPGNNQVILKLDDQAKGLYMLLLTNGKGQTYSQKIMRD